MAKIDAALDWMYQHKGKVTYSMANRWGPSSYDCSSAVYYALKHAGLFFSHVKIGNTDSLFGDLERAGWTKVQPEASGNIPARRGDVFIWGVRGASSNEKGHTGFFCDNSDNIIHCNYGYNGITVNAHDVIWAANGYPAVTVYRPPSEGPTDDEVYRDTRKAIEDIFHAPFVRSGDLAQAKFGDKKTSITGVFEWSDNNILLMTKRAEDISRLVRETQNEQTPALHQIEQKINSMWEGIFTTYTPEGQGHEKRPGILPLLEKIAQKEGI